MAEQAIVSANEGRLFSNLPSLITGGFTPDPGIGAGWVSFAYTLDDFSGVGLATGFGSGAGEMVLDLGLTGWHVLHFCHTPALRIWLDGETGYRELPSAPQYDGLSDTPMHAVNLTGQKVHIAPPASLEQREAILFYIRAVPCDGPRRGQRNLVAANDGHGVFWAGMSSLRDLSKYFTPFRDSDFFRMLWGVYGGSDYSTDPKTVGTLLPFPDAQSFYQGERIFNESIRRVAGEGDILAEVVAQAKAVDLELHFYFRVGAFYGVFPHHGTGSRFFYEHPKFHCRDEFGNEVKRLSFAFPAVQDHLLAYFEELLAYQPDGICLAFTRGLPVMACETPVLEAFEQRYGRKPDLPREDGSEEMLRIRHELLADFVARLHRLVTSKGKALSCTIPRNFAENYRRGLDVELLVTRVLLESVMVGAGHEDNPIFTNKHDLPPVDQDDFAPVLRLKALGKAKIYLGGCNGHGTFWPASDPMTRARRARAILDSELDGAYFWDTDLWFARAWDQISRYGDAQFLDALLNGQVLASRERDTLRIHDLTVDRYNPWNAY